MGETTTGAQMAANIIAVLKAARAGIPRDLDKVGTDIVNQLRLDLSQPGRGRVYTTYFWTDEVGRVHPGRERVPHVASAPGDPPAVDTGQLRASYGHHAERTPDGGMVTIGTADEKAKFLEFGTSRMEPRPHLRPVVQRNQAHVREVVADGVEGRERAMARRLGGEG